MRPLGEILGDARAFARITERERLLLAAELADCLGPGWIADSAGPGLALLFDGRQFQAVPGGSFIMGYSDADAESASEHVSWTSAVAERVRAVTASAEPARTVHVQPFLAATHLFADRLQNRAFSRPLALQVAAEQGFRLPSESELEWILRHGRRDEAFVAGARMRGSHVVFNPSPFHLEDVATMQWASDDWHPNYTAASPDSAPWLQGDPAGVVRSTFVAAAFEGPEDLVDALACVRTRGFGYSAAVRLIRSLPLSGGPKAPS